MEFQKLNLLFLCSRKISHEKNRMQDLSDTECMICSYIYSHENCSQDEAAAALKTDKTTVGKALVTLEKKALIVRTQDAQDRRVKRLTITEAGREKITGLLALHDRWMSEIMKCLSDDEKSQFESLCERLLVSAEALIEKQINGGLPE